MEEVYQKIILTTVLNQRRVLLMQKEISCSKIDFEILAFSFNRRLFCLNQVRKYFPFINPQYIKRSLDRLVVNQYFQIMQKGKGNKPTYYIIGFKGEAALKKFVSEIYRGI